MMAPFSCVRLIDKGDRTALAFISALPPSFYVECSIWSTPFLRPLAPFIPRDLSTWVSKPVLHCGGEAGQCQNGISGQNGHPPRPSGWPNASALDGKDPQQSRKLDLLYVEALYGDETYLKLTIDQSSKALDSVEKRASLVDDWTICGEGEGTGLDLKPLFGLVRKKK